MALNYGYAILLNRIYAAAVKNGLDPYCGVLHAVRSGKPSLVLDIMEQYRSYVVDRAVVKLKSRLSKTDNFEEIKSDLAFTILKNFDHYHVNAAIKMGDYNIGRNGQILTIPFYMGFLLNTV